MTLVADVVGGPAEQKTIETDGIPIQNLWHMLLYAMRIRPEFRLLSFEQEEAPSSLVGLLARLLCEVVDRRQRRSLPRDYRPTTGNLRFLRGKLDITTERGAYALSRGLARCTYDVFDEDIRTNQIVRATLGRLSLPGTISKVEDPKGVHRERIKQVLSRFPAVSPIQVTRSLISQALARHRDPEIRLMLNLCNLILVGDMPTEEQGRSLAKQLSRNEILRYVFESFVGNFYKLRLDPQVWTRRETQKPLGWAITPGTATLKAAEHLPGMFSDVVLTSAAKTIVLDTKFTSALTTGREGRRIFSERHMYQMLAYLSAREFRSASGSLEGILLYSAIKEHLDERIQLPGFTIRVTTVNLAQPWTTVEERLQAIVTH